jgi:hypothetical protein
VILLRVMIGLLSLVIGALLLPAPDVVGTFAVIALFFIGAVLVGGPWWPSRWRLKLPTDDPRVANIFLSAFVGAYAFYRAWDAYVNPDHKFVRLERIIVALLGSDGVTAFWIVIGFACLAGTVTLYAKGSDATLGST